MTVGPSLEMKKRIVEHMLPIMKDVFPDMPECHKGEHDWVIEYGKTIKDHFADVIITTTYQIAICCSNCNFTVGL